MGRYTDLSRSLLSSSSDRLSNFAKCPEVFWLCWDDAILTVPGNLLLFLRGRNPLIVRCVKGCEGSMVHH